MTHLYGPGTMSYHTGFMKLKRIRRKGDLARLDKKAREDSHPWNGCENPY